MQAIYYCCWNTSYCSYNCQTSHWYVWRTARIARSARLIWLMCAFTNASLSFHAPFALFAEGVRIWAHASSSAKRSTSISRTTAPQRVAARYDCRPGAYNAFQYCIYAEQTAGKEIESFTIAIHWSPFSFVWNQKQTRKVNYFIVRDIWARENITYCVET